MRLVPLAPLAGLALLLSSAAPCDAGAAGRRCSCMRPPDPATARDEATAVFLGTVVGDSTISAKAGSDESYERREVTFVVDAAWKGVQSDTVRVTTGFGGGDCGYEFVQGGSYLVFAHGEPARLATGICTLTRPSPLANGEFRRALGRSTFNRLPTSDPHSGW